MRKVVSIIFAIVAGFFIYLLDILAFIQLENLSIKLVIGGIYIVPAGISLFISLAMMRFQNWKKRIAWVLLGATATILFGGLTFICILTEPAFRQLLKPEQLSLFNDYLFGGIWNSILAALGVYLWQSKN